MILNFFRVFDDFSFSTKVSIEVISVGMERSNGILMEIFRLGEVTIKNVTTVVAAVNVKIKLDSMAGYSPIKKKQQQKWVLI